MNLVIVGGSFNPPHKAHKRIVEILCQKFDRVIIVPCGTRPDKASANILPIRHRMEMVKIAFGNLKKVFIDFYDFENNVYTPTYLLQKRYEERFPDTEIWHLIGEDIISGGRIGLSEIHRVWDFGEKIWNSLNFLVVVRPGYNAKSEDMPPHSKILEIGDIICSGTRIRKRISDNEMISDLVEQYIERYIKENKLYRSNRMSENDYEVNALINVFKNFRDRIYEYRYPEELFEELRGNSLDEKMESLKEKFRKLIIDYGADRYNHYNSQELFDISSEISRKIIEFENLAEQEICNGTYGEKRNVNSFVVNGKYEYQINRLESQADFSETFLGTYKDFKKNIQPICAKMARVSDESGLLLDSDEVEMNNKSIRHEINMLKHLDSINNDAFQKVRRQHFPILIDDFKISFGNIERDVMVTKHVPAYDFVALREKSKNGVPLYHACWMLARMLSAVGHLHSQNIIHGNIHPEGLFVNPQDHNVTIADFEFSIIDYESEKMKYIGITKDYTAPEVYKGAIPHPSADMYSIGMSMIYILGGDVEKRSLPLQFEMIDKVYPREMEGVSGIEGIKNLILSFVNQHPLARSDDAWRAYHQLESLRKLAFGEPSFVEFNV